MVRFSSTGVGRCQDLAVAKLNEGSLSVYKLENMCLTKMSEGN